MARRRSIASLIGRAAEAQEWKATVEEVRIGLMGGENTQDRLQRYDGFKKLLEAETRRSGEAVPVR